MMSPTWRLLPVDWLWVSLLILGCASASTPPPSPTATEAKPSDNNYLIGPGDTLEVFVWRNPELSVQVPVRPDGKISTPLVEDMVAIGKTPTQLARDMEKTLSVYVREPKVNIIVTNPIGLDRVEVVGQVVHPQELPYRAGMRVLDAILAVGGLTQFASGNRARIVRTDENGKTTTIHVKVGELANNGDVSQNLLLKPKDVLVVPQSIF